MEPQMKDRDTFTVTGAAAAGEPGKINYSEVWEKLYMPHDESIKPYSVDGGYYGVTLSEGGQLIYLAGMAVSELPEVPPEFIKRVIPRAHYAVFTCGMDAIGDTWHYAYDQWLPGSDYLLDDRAVDFEYYPQDNPEDMQVEIYIPVRAKEPVR